uniref:hypothetical protein n=1 Tax=Nonomuraea bangladeshensis TaxID=404385 RepID=UPI003F499989
MSGGLLLAATQVDITPPAGHHLDGYAARSGVAAGMLDPLSATAVWLSSADDPGILWLSIDAVGVSVSLADELAALTALPRERVLVCASHTHSGPSGWSGKIHPLLPAPEGDELRGQLMMAVADLPSRKVPVDAVWCAADAPGVGANRHRQDGPHDTTAGVLALRDPAGAIAAMLVDYACHPTVLGPENLLWSADWPGAARAALAGALRGLYGEAPVIGFLQGAAGDVSPRFVRQGRDAAEVARLGALLAGPVLAKLHERPSPQPETALSVRRTTVRLPVRRFPNRLAARTLLEQERRAAAGVTDRLAYSRVEGAYGLLAMAEAGLPADFDLPISVVTLGESIAWVHLPVELFATLGEQIKAGSSYPVTRIIGYTDGYLGYVVDGAAERDGTYEAQMSYFDAAAGQTLVEAAISLLRQTPGEQA